MLKNLLKALLDAIVIFIGFLLAFSLRWLLGECEVLPTLEPRLPTFFENFYLLNFFIFHAVLVIQGLYSTPYSLWEESRRILLAAAFWLFIFVLILALRKEMQNYSRVILVLQAITTGTLLIMLRAFLRYPIFKAFNLLTPVQAIGVQKDLNTLSPSLKSENHIKEQFLLPDTGNFHQGFDSEIFQNPKDIFCRLLNSEALQRDFLIRWQNVEWTNWETLTRRLPRSHRDQSRLFLFFDEKISKDDWLKLHETLFGRVSFFILSPPTFAPTSWKGKTSFIPDVGELIFYDDNHILLPHQAFVKRASDLLILFLTLPLVLPLMILIAILVRSDSPGSIFYSHERVGKRGKTFRVWKFRTMYQDADQRLMELLHSDPNLAKEWRIIRKIKNDPRVTRVGKWLRKTSLDELPQLWNIFKGEMSFVGPRPVTEQELEMYYKNSRHVYECVRPGLSGLWQISGRNSLDYAKRVQLDKWYVFNWSLWFDMVILIKTVKVVITREGAH